MQVQSNFGSNASSNAMYMQEQFEALKRQASPSSTSGSTSGQQSGAGGGGSGNAHTNASSNSNNNSSNNGNGPYMVLTQVAVPSNMLGQFNNNNINASQLQQLQQQLQQQQQQGGSNQNNQDSNASQLQQQPQILSFHQLPPQIQQQVLLQQQQLQAGRNNQNQNSNSGQQQQQQQQQQLWKQMQQQQQPQPQQHKKRMSISDVQELMKNNQLDANMMKQLLANAAGAPAPSNNSNNSTSNDDAHFDNSFGELLSAFHRDMSSSSNNTTTNNNNNASSSSDNNKEGGDTTSTRLFLEAQVQPVHRANNHSQDSCNSDDDLFKFFDVDNMGDDNNNDFLNPSNLKVRQTKLSSFSSAAAFYFVLCVSITQGEWMHAF